ncbi:unnamed protein product [Rangifer tarandus platyrhynchus]|uniref:Uncharacterized protein n=2 Tax=Rangifer tarandus platyrhynchus TaxID=3082113 RepID=A0ACB0EN01_RANTA|nr:unnamed protein product [Rangifer tarandus platyrhynchus]CAI9702107.1 unnamed protein product [Rangifer tarandus platyrhynchus]
MNSHRIRCGPADQMHPEHSKLHQKSSTWNIRNGSGTRPTGYQAELTSSGKPPRSAHQGRASAEEPPDPGALGAALSFPRVLQPASQVRAALGLSTVTEQPLRWK